MDRTKPKSKKKKRTPKYSYAFIDKDPLAKPNPYFALPKWLESPHPSLLPPPPKEWFDGSFN
jgi:hypothetical protein